LKTVFLALNKQGKVSARIQEISLVLAVLSNRRDERLSQCFPTFLGLRHPTDKKYNLRRLVKKHSNLL